MIPHNKPTLGELETDAVKRVLKNGWVAQGPEVEAFEQEITNYLGLPDGHAVVVSSGTAALFLALWVLGADNETSVGIPVYACSALRNAVAFTGAKAVFLDTGPKLPNIDLGKINSAEIDILVAAYMFGFPERIQNNHSYQIIEDLAQAFGASVDGVSAGLNGDIGICSFYATKLFTTGGQGGAIVSRKRDLIDKIRDYREFDCRDDNNIRFNFQMTDIQASIGRVQLNRLKEFIEKRIALMNIYRAADLPLLESSDKGIKTVPYRAIVRSGDPKQIIAALKCIGVNSIIPVERWELLDNDPGYVNAISFTRELLSLPVYPSLNMEDAQRIAKVVKSHL